MPFEGISNTNGLAASTLWQRARLRPVAGGDFGCFGWPQGRGLGRRAAIFGPKASLRGPARRSRLDRLGPQHRATASVVGRSARVQQPSYDGGTGRRSEHHGPQSHAFPAIRAVPAFNMKDASRKTCREHRRDVGPAGPCIPVCPIVGNPVRVSVYEAAGSVKVIRHPSPPFALCVLEHVGPSTLRPPLLPLQKRLFSGSCPSRWRSGAGPTIAETSPLSPRRSSAQLLRRSRSPTRHRHDPPVACVVGVGA